MITATIFFAIFIENDELRNALIKESFEKVLVNLLVCLPIHYA
ncbi:hypothetical protein EV06_0574 [Prochlorococcus sp. MIT 0602]|nr:hypothetical protein EV06_0574 [Prochlorococcus sp. MIT 0602]KGG18295.1 hypothetical protein EV07_0211 [Prochlorococcus sp. MIT 0603]